MADKSAEDGRTILFCNGAPADVEDQIEHLKDDYVCTSVFFYVRVNQLEVAVTMVHKREMLRAQLAQSPIAQALKMRPN